MYTRAITPGLAEVPEQGAWPLQTTPPLDIAPVCLGERSGVPHPPAQRVDYKVGTPHPSCIYSGEVTGVEVVYTPTAETQRMNKYKANRSMILTGVT